MWQKNVNLFLYEVFFLVFSENKIGGKLFRVQRKSYDIKGILLNFWVYSVRN